MRIFAGIYRILGNLNLASANMEKAKYYYEKAIYSKSKNAETYLHYAIIVLREGDWEHALSLLENAASKKPKIIAEKGILLTMGSAYWVGGQLDKAIDTLEGLQAKYSYLNPNTLTTLAYMYYLKQDNEKAIATTLKALDDDPAFGAAWDNLGQIYYSMGDREKALENFEKAVSFKANLPDSLYFLGVMAEENGDTAAAKLYFERARESGVTSLNTVTKEQIEERCAKYAEV